MLLLPVGWCLVSRSELLQCHEIGALVNSCEEWLYSITVTSQHPQHPGLPSLMCRTVPFRQCRQAVGCMLGMHHALAHSFRSCCPAANRTQHAKLEAEANLLQRRKERQARA